MSITHDRNVAGGLAKPKVMANYGINEYYKFYKSKKGSLDKETFAAVIRECNKVIVEEILEDAEEYTLPYGMGRVSFRKRKNKAYVSNVNGKVRTNAMIDWKKTMELWEDNSHARRNRIRVRYNNMHTGRYSFRVAMFGRKFTNKEYFAFQFKRSFKRKFAERIFTYNKDKIEARIVKTI